KKIGPDPRNFNQRVSLGRNDLLIRTFPNLRNVSVEENNRNRASVKGKKNGCTGVYWCHTHHRYRARIKVNGKNIHIGYFNTINEAREERKKAELANGFHSNHGRASEVIHHERS
ncbi:hypothetical protein ACUNI2_20585, partial [Serratia sp. IR-2025]